MSDHSISMYMKMLVAKYFQGVQLSIKWLKYSNCTLHLSNIASNDYLFWGDILHHHHHGHLIYQFDPDQMLLSTHEIYLEILTCKWHDTPHLSTMILCHDCVEFVARQVTFRNYKINFQLIFSINRWFFILYILSFSLWISPLRR